MGKRAGCKCGHERLGLQIVGPVLRWPGARGSVHRLRAPAGWAIQKDVLQFHVRDVRRVEIVDVETGATYTAGLSDFIRAGVEIERGYGAQLALPLASWHMAGAGETSSASSASSAQLVLFDVPGVSRE